MQTRNGKAETARSPEARPLPIRDNQASNLPNIEADHRPETSGVKGEGTCPGCGDALIEVGPLVMHACISDCPGAAAIRVEGSWVYSAAKLAVRLDTIRRARHGGRPSGEGSEAGGTATVGGGRAPVDGGVGARLGCEDARLEKGRAVADGLLVGAVRAATAEDGPAADAVKAGAPCPGDVVEYAHPSWGTVVATVLDAGVCHGAVLVQDHHPHGAREWWPVADLRVVTRAR